MIVAQTGRQNRERIARFPRAHHDARGMHAMTDNRRPPIWRQQYDVLQNIVLSEPVESLECEKAMVNAICSGEVGVQGRPNLIPMGRWLPNGVPSHREAVKSASNIAIAKNEAIGGRLGTTYEMVKVDQRGLQKWLQPKRSPRMVTEGVGRRSAGPRGDRRE